MAENDDKKQEGQSADQPQIADLLTSITMAFNTGVSAYQQAMQAGQSGHFISVADIAQQLGQQIYENLSRTYSGQRKEEVLMVETEYFLKIALLGFIIPSVCAFEEDFKNRLFNLIEAKQQSPESDPGGGKSSDSDLIIT